MERKTYKRNELNTAHTWNVYSIFSDEAAYEKALGYLKSQVETFHATYINQLNEPEKINQALDELRKIQQLITKTSAFQSLQMSTDSTNLDNQVRSGKYQIFIQEVVEKLSFVTNELNDQSVDVLKKAQKENKENSLYLQEIIDNSKHKLSKEVEETIIAFSPTLNAAYTNYQRFKFIDMKFSDFEVNGKKYANSFTLFEN
ncbi:MAG: oligoendopeptidase F family protein, partial [Candidatus Phytoplasma sp.]|nr:oligoendopeptidase F family protein [Phytoplasma sp.]